MKDEGGRMKALPGRDEKNSKNKDQRTKLKDVHPSSLILPPCSLRDGVTGSTSGFELEDEGSTPSPAANLPGKSQGTSLVIDAKVRRGCRKHVHSIYQR